MIPEGLPGYLAYQSVILVAIQRVMREHQVWPHSALDVLESCFYVREMCGQMTIRQLSNVDFAACLRAHELAHRPQSFVASRGIGG